MKVQYLEIVASDVDAVCASYEAAHGIKFGSPDPRLGGARTAELADGGSIGVRAPLSPTEEPIVRPYWLVDDIYAALGAATEQGAVVAHPPLDIPGKGVFAIYIQGGVNHGLWQLDSPPRMTRLTGAEPQLFVRDIAASSEFYSRKLGFSVAFIYGDPPFYGQLFRDGARLNLRQVDDAQRDSGRRDGEEIVSATITLEDARSLFNEYQAAGVEFVRPIRTEPWGSQTFIVRDPDGNLLLFAGRGQQ